MYSELCALHGCVISVPRLGERAAGCVTIPDTAPLKSGGCLKVFIQLGENPPNSLISGEHKSFCQLVGFGKVGLSFFWS